MEQNKKEVDCTPNKQEQGAIDWLIQMSKDMNSISTCKMSYDDGYVAEITVRKKGAIANNEFSVEQYELIKAMAEEKLAQAEDKQKLQKIIDVCESNIADMEEKEEESLEDEE